MSIKFFHEDTCYRGTRVVKEIEVTRRWLASKSVGFSPIIAINIDFADRLLRKEASVSRITVFPVTKLNIFTAS